MVYVAIVLPMSTRARQQTEDAANRASMLVNRLQVMHGYDLVNLAVSIADRKEFMTWTKIPDEAEDAEKKRRIAVFDAIQQFDKKLKEEGRKAHFFGVLGPDGSVIARDLDIKNMYGEKLDFHNIREALEGRTSKDIWHWKNRMMRSAAAPIIVEGQVEGVVAIAYSITSSEARTERDQFGADVVYFMDNAIRASSFTQKHSRDREDAAKVDALSRKLLSGANSPAKKALAAKKATSIFEIELNGESYMAITGPLPGLKGTNSTGYVVLSSLTKAQAPISNVRWCLLLSMIASLLVVLSGMWLLARHFLNSEDKLELGVSEVINGNLEYSFEAVQEFEGLANAINVMLNRLLGRPEPGDEEMEESQALLDANVVLFDEPDDDDLGSELQNKLAAEDDETHFAGVYTEYIKAREDVGLPTEGITEEGLGMKLKANEAILKAKFKCERVRFTVAVDGGKVSFKPIRIG